MHVLPNRLNGFGNAALQLQFEAPTGMFNIRLEHNPSIGQCSLYRTWHIEYFLFPNMRLEAEQIQAPPKEGPSLSVAISP